MKKLAVVLLLAFIAIQFFRPEKNIQTSPTEVKNHISATYTVPAEVELILQSSCYDCHSNQTKYPWYSNVQPVAWFLANHVEEGKKELNFSEFSTYTLRRQFKKFGEIIDEVDEDKMPLKSFTLIHKDAVLTDAQKTSLISWATSNKELMKSKYPADSLNKK